MVFVSAKADMRRAAGLPAMLRKIMPCNQQPKAKRFSRVSSATVQAASRARSLNRVGVYQGLNR